MKKIVNKIQNFFNKKVTENEYYEELFIDNNSWNTATPNNDELKRWSIIEKMIIYEINEKDLKILDLGSGRGWLTNLLSSYGNVMGIEPVENVVNYAKKLFPKINFVHGKANSLLDEHANTFDLIVSSEVIEHIPDEEKGQFAIEINSLLKDNGHLIITTPRKDIQKDWIKYLKPGQPVEDWISEEELQKLFQENGFKPEKIDRIPLRPSKKGPLMDIYQVWYFKKKVL